ncbi:MAG: helix-turn-helix transcriptional regulator [Spirochaetes bacterium]|nr:helix-turn-helix transcriptional regulator [Spirochaetota bacterium]
MNNNIDKSAFFFKTLGDPTRIKILNLLKLYGNLCVGIMAQKLGITQPAVSQHLRILKNAGIVEASRIGFHVHYKINDDAFEKYGLKIEKIIDQDFKKCEMDEKCKNNPNKLRI